MMRNKICVIVLVATNLYIATFWQSADALITTPQIIKGQGYPVQLHKVQTEDGYILNLHRIPYGKLNRNMPKPRIPVLLQHGMDYNSGSFVALSTSESLGFILADLGYDVWLGNARGNIWPSKHISIDPLKDPKKYFNFSWHEMGIYDLPACIDYILYKTRVKAIHYIGFSQGCTSFYVMASTRPEYNKKIILASLMAPVAFIRNIVDPYIKIFSQHLESFQKMANDLGLHHFAQNNVMPRVLSELCLQERYFSICLEIVIVFGSDENVLRRQPKQPPTVINNPSDFALKQAFHYLQLVRSGHFRQYDYGRTRNLQMYGSVSPPDYNISLITAPVAIYYAKNDIRISAMDVKLLASKLPKLVKIYMVPYDNFTHGDFIEATNAKSLIYGELIIEMKKREI